MSDQNILVELDALLDTRITTLCRCNPAAGAYMMMDPYWERLSDDFEKYTEGMVTNEAFREMYGKRDRDTLIAAKATNMCLLLTQIFNELGTQQVASPLVEDLVLTVNFYPYVLEPNEVEAYLTNISVFVNHCAKIKATWLAPTEITPILLDAEYAAYILYDFNEWMTVQEKAFDAKGVPKVSVFAPAISFVKDFTEEDITVESVGAVNVFELIEFSSRPYMDLHLIKPAYYCPVV